MLLMKSLLVVGMEVTTVKIQEQGWHRRPGTSYVSADNRERETGRRENMGTEKLDDYLCQTGMDMANGR